MLKNIRSMLCFITPCAILVILSGCTGPSTSSHSSPNSGRQVVQMWADYPRFDSIDALVDGSDSVIAVRYVSAHSEMIYPDLSNSADPLTNPQAGVKVSKSDKERMGVPSTVSVVQVTSSLKGSHKPGDFVRITQLGGVIDNVDYVENDTMLLENVDHNQSLLLFVSEHNGNGADLVNPEDGVMAIAGDTLTAARDTRGHKGRALAGNLGSVKAAIHGVHGC